MTDEATIEGLMKLIRELREHEFAHRLDEAEDCTLAISGQLAAFADRIRQDAMEEAAKICDAEALRMKAQIADDVWCGHADTGAMVCASAIRSRKPQTMKQDSRHLIANDAERARRASSDHRPLLVTDAAPSGLERLL